MDRRKRRHIEQYQDMVARLLPERHIAREDGLRVLSRTVTFQVTEDCNLACSYCYQGHKTKKAMTFETAKKAVDMLLSSDENNQYINPAISPGIIIEFIGGEPLLEIELIDKTIDYFKKEARRLQHPWAEWFCISICSNGVLYFDERVQRFLMKNRNNISFSITIDGNKELHDSCRVFHDGKPSYDLAVAAAIDWMNRGYYMGSKITIAPENITFLYDAITHMIGLGYTEINANCVYEEGWTPTHATVLYHEMKRISDYLFEHDLEDDIYISLFEDNFFRPMDEGENLNWCWGKGTPILTTEGYKPIEEIEIGDYVYTEDGSTHPVINTLSHFADNVVNISMSGVFDLVCTDNHQLFTKPFDYRGWKNLNHYKEKVKSQIKDIQHKDLIELFRLPEGTVNYNTKLAYLVGRYIGDGWHYKDGGLKNKDGSDGYGICCSFSEQKELEHHFSDAAVEFCSSKNKTVAQYTISRRGCNNPNNIELLRILSKCGRLAHGKHLPPECFNWTKESLTSLINGYMDADGSLDKKNDLYKFNTTSYQLAQELMVILRTIGYSPTCYHNKRGGKNVIQGREVNIRDRYEVYFYKNADKTRYIHESDGNIWSYGLKATPTESQMVYNITVDTNHSYIAGGIASSNCGGTCDMLCIDPEGNYSVCIRYLPSSLGDDQPPIYLGNVDRGLITTDEEKKCVECMKCITRRSQSTDECFNCPIAHGCSWCSAYNYQITGTVDQRVTYICIMHKARSLANAYFWNKYYRKHGDMERFKIHCPDEWALEIISQDELNMLKELENPDTE